MQQAIFKKKITYNTPSAKVVWHCLNVTNNMY